MEQRFLADLRGLLTSVWELAQNNRASHPALPLVVESGGRSGAQQGLPLPSETSSW